MKDRIVSLVFFSIGIFLFYINIDSQLTTIENSQIKISFYENLEGFRNYEFIGIFINNIIVGFLLSVFGYLTGGFLTLLILIWNGFLVAIVYNMAFYQLPLDTILYASKHVPIEVYAFLIFSEFGLKGRYFFLNIFKNNEIDFKLTPKYKTLILPIVLLFIAAILETI